MKEFKEIRTTLSEEVVEENVQSGMPPNILVLRRQSVRQFPDHTMVALYYNDKLDQYFSIPYGGKATSTITPASLKEETSQEAAVKHAEKVSKTWENRRKRWSEWKAKQPKVWDPATKKYVVQKEEVDQLDELKSSTMRWDAYKQGQQKPLKEAKYHVSVEHGPTAADVTHYKITAKSKKEAAELAKKKHKKANAYHSPMVSPDNVTLMKEAKEKPPTDAQVRKLYRTHLSNPNDKVAHAAYRKAYKAHAIHSEKVANKMSLAKGWEKDPHTFEEGVLSEDAISHLRKVVNFETSSALKHKNGQSTKVDPTTAKALLAVHDALGDENKKKFADHLEHSKEKLHKMVDFAWKQVK